jgi:two-component system LytT family response regulator/two-component system response regulator LytT
MPGLDGLGVIRRLKETNSHLPYFILATAFDQYAVEAFELEALDYVLKPYDPQRLEASVTRAVRMIQERQKIFDPPAVSPQIKPALQRTKLLVRTGQRNMIVDAADIVYATIDDGLITVVTTTMEGMSNYRTIEELQSNLDPDTFWRVHRSYLVNINRIKEVIPWFKSSFQLKMEDKRGSEVPVSRVQTKRLRALLKL